VTLRAPLPRTGRGIRDASAVFPGLWSGPFLLLDLFPLSNPPTLCRGPYHLCRGSGLRFAARFIADSSPTGIVMEMTEGKDTHAAQQKEPGKDPGQRRLWASTGFQGRTLWEWLQFMGTAFLPVYITALGIWVGWIQFQGQQSAEEQRSQDEALQAYLDQMSMLLTEEHLRTSEAGDEVRLLARARTLTVLTQLEANPREAETDKEQAMEFLIEAELVQRMNGEDPIISLEETDLDGVDLDQEDLRGVDLENATLRDANLEDANLEGATMPDGSKHP
jgi:hypothetical protein